MSHGQPGRWEKVSQRRAAALYRQRREHSTTVTALRQPTRERTATRPSNSPGQPLPGQPSSRDSHPARREWNHSSHPSDATDHKPGPTGLPTIQKRWQGHQGWQSQSHRPYVVAERWLHKMFMSQSLGHGNMLDYMRRGMKVEGGIKVAKQLTFK